MKVIKSLILLILIGLGTYFVIDKSLENAVIQTMGHKPTKEVKETTVETKSLPEQIHAITGFEGDLYEWMDKDTNQLKKELGDPVRKDLSSYGYTWWVYTNGINQHIQFGIQDGVIVTIFATGDNLSTEPIAIGQSYEEIDKMLDFRREVSFSNFRFTLSDAELNTRPLSQIDENKFVEFYFDSFSKRLSSIRILSKDVLLMQRPYEVYYHGSLPEAPLLTDQEWDKVESGMEKQIFDITNVIRNRFDRSQLVWDDSVASVAFGHSKDMAVQNYFSHYTPEGEGLKERLEEGDVIYFAAGENIAAQYTDGPAAVEGWLNSEGHRDALLKDDYTHLGVGVYKYYYTQNFLTKSKFTE
ncbi:CAP domain-containing protein [Aquibacillus kalidii]|uniref:CAP domain-containing protein n=1 Tax=Aquibacillus kalidii TaxID=2762597 RepID=UPI00164940F0|nr:CAP domain-containing protein [Aquibacillus kalidii]